MKLLIVTAIREYEKDIKSLLKKSDIRAYTYLPATGCMDAHISEEANWFAATNGEIESILFYAIVQESNAINFFDEVTAFNGHVESKSKIHAALSHLEKVN